jgi:hypothetical protein
VSLIPTRSGQSVLVQRRYRHVHWQTDDRRTKFETNAESLAVSPLAESDGGQGGDGVPRCQREPDLHHGSRVYQESSYARKVKTKVAQRTSRSPFADQDMRQERLLGYNGQGDTQEEKLEIVAFEDDHGLDHKSSRELVAEQQEQSDASEGLIERIH